MLAQAAVPACNMGIGRALVVGRAAIASLLYAAEIAWARPLTLPNLRTLARSFGEQVDDGKYPRRHSWSCSSPRSLGSGCRRERPEALQPRIKARCPAHGDPRRSCET